MTAKEMMREVRNTEERVKDLKAQRAHYMDVATNASVPIGDGIRGGSGGGGRVEAAVLWLDDLDRQIEAATGAYTEAYMRAAQLIGRLTSDAAIAGIGQSLGRGTIISILLVMFVLPQILLLGEKVIDKTSFSVHGGVKQRRAGGRVRVDGMVYGEISGTVYGMVHAVVDGDVDVKLVSGSVAEEGIEEITEKGGGSNEVDAAK